MNFAHYVEAFQRLYLDAGNAQETPLALLADLLPTIPKKILILAPHPDDECLMSGLALRAREEFQSEVVVVPFSYGSKLERRGERKKELQSALQILGFAISDPRSNADQEELKENELRKSFEEENPNWVILPHDKDGHPTHVRASLLGRKALVKWRATLKNDTVYRAETEFWQSMEGPNVLVPLAAKHLIQMGEALIKHQGEISRNPYHLRLPAWSMDQARRGSEMVVNDKGELQAGRSAADVVFGQLYRIERV